MVVFVVVVVDVIFVVFIGIFVVDNGCVVVFLFDFVGGIFVVLSVVMLFFLDNGLFNDWIGIGCLMFVLFIILKIILLGLSLLVIFVLFLCLLILLLFVLLNEK